jgi:hypothetical protein
MLPEAIQPSPHMDDEGLKYFKDIVAKTRCYLEYGSGGSTVYAANVAKVPTVISVESDKDWTERTKAAIHPEGISLFLEHCDIGATGAWGAPINRERVTDFWTYIVAPWKIARTHSVVPDTVLIDGRFRVASFLFSLINCRLGTQILFDDYFDRPHYFAAEQYCRVREKQGRMAVFVADHAFSNSEICEKLLQYSMIWD